MFAANVAQQGKTRGNEMKEFLFRRIRISSIASGTMAAVSGIATVVAIVSLLTVSESWGKDDYPNHPITILVGFSVGGGADTAARIQGKALSKLLGVPIVVRNVPGAGGRNAVTLLNRAKPDGYTMATINVPGQIVNQVVRGLPPDLKKFTWIGRQVSQLYFTQASTKYPWTSLKDMKKAKKPIRAGTTGTGGNNFPISAIATNIVGYPVRYIPGFKAPELITAIIRGDIEITTQPLLKPYVAAIDSGDARAIVLYGPERHPLWPDIPTAADQGFPELAGESFVGQNLYAFPPDTPAGIARVMEDALMKISHDKETVKTLEQNGNLARPLDAKGSVELVNTMFEMVNKNRALLKQYIK
jgi:tripartite-type tricarboxylate transporter receptor subunit TctC